MSPIRAAMILLALVALVVAACGGAGDGGEPTVAPTEAPIPTLSTGDLARSVVQIVALDASRTPVWTGSGTVVTPEGLILTNAHVVDDRFDEYALLGVAVIERTDQPPEPSFLAEIVAVDYALDLAVIRIATDLDGAVVEPDLVALAIGDSSLVELGDAIRILGFPGIGGETITFTEGSVSGFTAQRSVADRAWIKTDATISGGNSGGLAANLAGEIIGVPTIVGSSGDAESLVDCRYVVDTNRDGFVDSDDTCVPVGGFINGLRPVALAIPLIEAARAGETYVSAFDVEPAAAGTFDVEEIFFHNFVFSDGVTPQDTPTEVRQALLSGVTDVCAFWDYEGMADGVVWEALWFVDGELDEQGSIIDETWFGGETGTWWVCNFDDRGLPAGLYELVLSVEGEFQGSDSLYVGGSHPLVEFGVDNQSVSPVCFALISPTDAENWGQDELDPEEIIEPGGSRLFLLPATVYDLLLLDCDENVIVEEYELDATEGGVYTVE